MKHRVNIHLAIMFFCIFILPLTVISQEHQFCPVNESFRIESEIANWGLTKQGTVKALFIFIDFPDSNFDVSNPIWPVGVGPNYLNDIVDSTETQNSGKPNNVTTYFNNMSFGKFKMIGKAYYRQAPYLLSEYAINHKDEECDYATKDVIDLLDQDIDFADYDKWINDDENFSLGSDDVLDMVIVCFRHWYLNRGIYGSSFTSLGWAPLSLPGGNVEVDNGTRYISTGVDVADMINFPLEYETVLHEIGHHWNLGHNYTGGVWSVMGRKNISYNMNSFEREKLGWLNNFIEITVDGQEVTIPDFETSGVACRINIPGANEYYYFENHQLLKTYDVVDRTGAPGLYILHLKKWTPPFGGEARLSLVNADGKWNWSVPMWIPSPWGNGLDPKDILPVFKREALNRISGVNDRGNIYFPENPNSYCKPPFPALIWIDEKTGQMRIDGQPFSRTMGDGKDRYTLDGNNMFSPWSASAAYTSDHNPTTVGAEIINQFGTDVVVRFYLTNPENGPPSQPQDVHAFFSSVNSVKVYWCPNVEPDMAQGSGYGYDIYRGVYYEGNPPTFTKINSSLITTTTYLDQSIPSRPPGDTVYLCYYIRATDKKGKLSVPSDDGWLNMDAPITNSNIITLSLASYLEPGSGGTYSIESINVGPSGSRAIPQGQSITIEALPPNSTWRIVNWNDGSTQNPRILTPISDTIMNAVFKKKLQFSFALNPPTSIEPDGGTYEVNGTYVGTSWNQILLEGDAITIKAVPIGGWFFLKWSDGDTTNPRSITINNDMTISAVFKMHLGSSIPTATCSNSQRKIVKDYEGTLHVAYESGGHVWYTSSTDDGLTWSMENHCCDDYPNGVSSNRNPAISFYRYYERPFPPEHSDNLGISEVTYVTIPVITWEHRIDTSDYCEIRAKWFESYEQHISSSGKFNSPNFANPVVSSPYLYFCGSDGIYYSVFQDRVFGFSTPSKINGTSTASQNPSASGNNVVWEENGNIMYCDVSSGSIETVVSANAGEVNSSPCISANWISWEYSYNTNPYKAIQARNRNGINNYGPISTFHDSTKALNHPHCRPSIFTYVEVFILWDDGANVKRVLREDGEWGTIETIRENVYAPQISIRDSLGSIREVALLSGLQGPPYPLISHPFYTFPSSLISINAGWNLVSVPRIMLNDSASVVFPDVGTPMGYNNATQSYFPATTLENGPGYWINFPQSDTVYIYGPETPSLVVPVAQRGWVIIGSRAVPIPVSSLIVSGGNSISGEVGYTLVPGLGYRAITVIYPGQGAWIYIVGPSPTCTITIP